MEPKTHDVGTEENWNESYYFVFFDKENNIGGMSRVGFKPNRPEGMTFLFLFLPNGDTGAYHQTDEGKSYPEALKVVGIEHTPQEDGTWRYTFEGGLLTFEDSEVIPEAREDPSHIKDLVESSFDLVLHPIHEEYEYAEHMTAESLEIGKKSGDKHWEQIGKVTGTITIEEETYEIKNCMGQRDHTHGIRDWTGVGNWFYFVVWFNENLCVNPAAIIMDDGRMGTGGFIFKNGENIPLVGMELKEHDFREDGLFPKRTVLELKDAKGGTHTLIGKPGAIVPVPFSDKDGNQSILVQSLGEFQLDDNKEGYGSYEVLRRLSKE